MVELRAAILLMYSGDILILIPCGDHVSVCTFHYAVTWKGNPYLCRKAQAYEVAPKDESRGGKKWHLPIDSAIPSAEDDGSGCCVIAGAN